MHLSVLQDWLVPIQPEHLSHKHICQTQGDPPFPCYTNGVLELMLLMLHVVLLYLCFLPGPYSVTALVASSLAAPLVRFSCSAL